MAENPAIEIIKGKPSPLDLAGKLYWFSCDKPPSSTSSAYFFNVDNVIFPCSNYSQELLYDAFNKDFGPLNLAKTHKYMRELVRLLSVSLCLQTHLLRTPSTRTAKFTTTPQPDTTSRPTPAT
jgi:hypothetical protein